MPSVDGKFYKTDVATAEQLFRLIQSIPSPKAEPFKLWIAKVAAARWLLVRFFMSDSKFLARKT